MVAALVEPCASGSFPEGGWKTVGTVCSYTWKSGREIWQLLNSIRYHILSNIISYRTVVSYHIISYRTIFYQTGSISYHIISRYNIYIYILRIHRFTDCKDDKTIIDISILQILHMTWGFAIWLCGPELLQLNRVVGIILILKAFSHGEFDIWQLEADEKGKQKWTATWLLDWNFAFVGEEGVRWGSPTPSRSWEDI